MSLLLATVVALHSTIIKSKGQWVVVSYWHSFEDCELVVKVSPMQFGVSADARPNLLQKQSTSIPGLAVGSPASALPPTQDWTQHL